jgi:hypothetical protein
MSDDLELQNDMIMSLVELLERNALSRMSANNELRIIKL